MIPSRSSSRTSLSDYSSEHSEEQVSAVLSQKANDKPKTNDKSPLAPSASTASSSLYADEKQKSRRAPASSGQALQPPVVRQRLVERQRSNSQPILIRPRQTLDDPAISTSHALDDKSLPAVGKSRNSGSKKPLSPTSSTSGSTFASTSSALHDNVSLSTTRPKLQTRKPNPARKSLTPEQQLSRDLADLMDKHLLRKSGRVDDDIDPSQMTLSLQKFAGKPGHSAVRIDALMLKAFATEMKKTDAWEIARQIAVKIKIVSFTGKDDSSANDEKERKEAEGLLNFLSTSMAGAFFNVSGDDEKIRLPQPLTSFLIEMDHRKLRQLLSSNAGVNMSTTEFLRARKESLSLVVLDAFLIPLITAEFFPVRTTIESDKVLAYVIQSLHQAWSVSSDLLLKNSLDTAPEDIATLMLKRRSQQLKPKASTSSSAHATSPLSTTTSPSRARRSELRALLNGLQEKLKPLVLTDDMLDALKSFNNEFATQKGPINEDRLYPLWLQCIEAMDPESDAAKVIRDWVEFDQDLLEVDLLSKLAAIEASGKAPTPERARRLTSGLPLSPLSPLSPLELKQRGQRAPTAPSDRLLNHRRTRTADAVMPLQKIAESRLTSGERQALIDAFPGLLLDSVKRAAMRKTEQGMVLRKNPVQDISMAGRSNLFIALDRLPRSLGEKIRPLTRLDEHAKSISHAKLWAVLMRDALTVSEAGRGLLGARSHILDMQPGRPSMPGAQPLNADEHARKKVLSEQMKPHVDKVLTDIFGKGLSGSGLPDELLDTLKTFDRQLLAWSDTMPTVKAKIDELRSNLLYDLVITRLIFPLVIGKVGKSSHMSEGLLGEVVRASLKPLWDKTLFPDFMARQAIESARSMSTSSSASATTHASDTH